MHHLVQKYARYCLLLVCVGCFVAPLLTTVVNLTQHVITHPETLLSFCSFSFLKKIGHSILLSTTVTGVSTLAGAALSYIFFGLKFSWQRTGMLFLMLVVFSISPIIYLVAMTRFELFNLLPIFWQSVIVLAIHMSPLPFAFLVVTVGFFNTSALNVAFLSSPPRSVFRHIIIPQLYFPLIIAGLIIFMSVFSHHEVTSFLGYRTYAEDFLSRVVMTTELPEASVHSIPFLLLGCVAVALVSWLISQSHFYNLFDQTYNPTSLIIQSHKVPLLISTIFLACIILGTFITLLKSVDGSTLYSMVTDNLGPVKNSICIALLSAVIATTCACNLHTFFRKGRNRTTLLLGVTILLFYWFLPSSLSALGIIGLTHKLNLNSQFYDFIVLLFGYQTKLLPLALLIIAALQMVHKTQEDIVTKLLIISKYDIFTKLIIPVQWPQWLLTTTILTVIALNELSLTILLVPPGVETVVIKIYNLMHYGDYSLVSFLSLVQISLISIIVLLTSEIIKRYDQT